MTLQGNLLPTASLRPTTDQGDFKPHGGRGWRAKHIKRGLLRHSWLNSHLNKAPIAEAHRQEPYCCLRRPIYWPARP